MRIIFSIFLWGLLALTTLAIPAQAETPKRYASIVVDADTLDIIHARQIDEQRYPASLTKVMTLYLTFDAINRGEITLDDKLIVSGTAARTPPFGLGLTRGQSMTVDQAIQAVAVRSANDAAVVLAEKLAGSEELFAIRMTEKARQLGMLKTTYKTASGLPHPDQQTTARDMAKLAMAILNDHRRYYHYFGQTEFTWKGRTKKNTNGLLHWLAGIDGFKTGYTRASGYNLIISGQRDGRRIIAVVLGGASGNSRNKHMQDLVERSFKTLGVQPVTSRPPVVIKEKAPEKAKPVQVASALRLRNSQGEFVTVMHGIEDIKLPSRKAAQSFSVQVGAFETPKEADAHLNYLLSLKKDNTTAARKSVSAVQNRGKTLHRARLNGLSSTQAHAMCQSFQQIGSGCLVIAPSQ